MIRKAYEEAFTSALEMNYDNLKNLSAFTEADQKKGILVLANKLYGMIVNRLTDIDFKEIEQTKGDITEFKYYNRTRESISVLKGLAKQSGDGIVEVEAIETALNNLESNKILFQKGFKADVSFIKYLYNTVAMGIIADIGFMTTVCVEFIKNPNNTVKMEIVNLKKYRSKFYLVHKNLIEFNKSVANKDFEKSVAPLLKIKTNHLFGTGGLATIVSAIPGGQYIAMVAAAILIIKNFVPMMRELAYFFYYFRVSISNYCVLQQKLLEANAEKLKSISSDDKNVEDTIEKQKSIASFFAKVANFFAIKYIPAQNKTEEETKKNAKTTLNDNDINDNPDISLF